MEIYELSIDGGVKKIAALPDSLGLVCAFGCFDGVHIGHQKLLSVAVEVSERLNVSGGMAEENCGGSNGTGAEGFRFAPAVWTFSEPVSKPWVISVAERLSLCGRFGIRYALCQRFEDVRALSPEEFVSGLVARWGLRRAVCGYNFRFGHMGVGDPARLEICLCESLRDVCGVGFGSASGQAVTVVSEVSALGGAVSSTRIRALLAEGEMETVGALLGRPYSLSGTVLAGKQIGRTISRPTANLLYASEQLIPKRGVYFTYCRVKGALYRAVTNVGYRPTVNSDTGSVTCEAHLLDFSDSVYGECAEIIFVHYHRAEIAFDSVERLSKQITEDVISATEYFDKHAFEDK